MPGRDKNIFLGNIVHALNPGWPFSERADPLLGRLEGRPFWIVKPLGKIMAMRLHSLAIEAPIEDMEDVTFAFKNSWGSSGAQGGVDTFDTTTC